MAAVSSTYARAFAEVVLDKKLDSTQVTQQLHSLVALCKENPDLRRVWETPSIPAPQKRAVLDAIAAGECFHPVVGNSVAVLIDHGHIPSLEPIVNQFEHELNERLGLAEAEVTSAHELGSEERHQLEAGIGAMVG